MSITASIDIDKRLVLNVKIMRYMYKCLCNNEYIILC